MPNEMKRRAVWTAGVIALAIAVVVLFLRKPTLAATAVAVLLTYAGVKLTVSRLREVDRASKWTVIRLLGKWRKSFKPPPIAMALYALSLAFFGLMLVLMSLTQSPWVIATVGSLGGIVLCTATALDWYIRLRYLYTFPHVKTIGRVLLAFFGLTTVFLSNIVAKQVVHSISLADPTATQDFLKLTSVFVFPIVLCAVFLAVLTALMVSQYVLLLLGLTVSSLVKNFSLLVTTKQRVRTEDFFYRIIYGKRRRKQNGWSPVADIAKGIPHVLRPLGTFAIAGVVIIVGTGWMQTMATIPSKYIQVLLIETEYHWPHLCENVDSTSRVSYHQDGYISVATKNKDGGYDFAMAKCHR